MPTVEIPGYGDVDFPDTMSDDEIVQAIEGMSYEDFNAPEVQATPSVLTPREEWKQTLNNKPAPSNIKVAADVAPGVVRDTVNSIIQVPQQLVNLGVAGAGFVGGQTGLLKADELPNVPFPPETLLSVERGARAMGLGTGENPTLDLWAGLDPELENMTDGQKVAHMAAKAGLLGAVSPGQSVKQAAKTAGTAATSGAIAQGLTNEGYPGTGLLLGLATPALLKGGAATARYGQEKAADFGAYLFPGADFAAKRHATALFNEAFRGMPKDEQKLVMDALRAGGSELVPGARPNVGQTIAGAQTNDSAFGNRIMQLQEQLRSTAASSLTERQQIAAVQAELRKLAGGGLSDRQATLAQINKNQDATVPPMFDDAADLANRGNVEMGLVESRVGGMNKIMGGLLGQANADLRTANQNAATQIPLLDEAALAEATTRMNALKQAGQMQAEALAAQNAATRPPQFPSRGLLELVERNDATLPPNRPRGLLTEEAGQPTTNPITGQFPAQQRTTVPGPLPAANPNVNVLDNQPNVPRRYSERAESDLVRAQQARETADEFQAAARAASDEIAALEGQKRGLLDIQDRAREGVTKTTRTAEQIEEHGRGLLSSKLDELASRGLRPLRSRNLVAYLDDRMEVPKNLPDGDVKGIINDIKSEILAATDPKTGRINAESLFKIRAKSNEKIGNLSANKPGWNDEEAAGEVIEFKKQIDNAILHAGGNEASTALRVALDKHAEFQVMKQAHAVKGDLPRFLESAEATTRRRGRVGPDDRFDQAMEKYLKSQGISTRLTPIDKLFSADELKRLRGVFEHGERDIALKRGAEGGTSTRVPAVRVPAFSIQASLLDKLLRRNMQVVQSKAEAELAKRMQTPQGLLGAIPSRKTAPFYNPNLALPFAVTAPGLLDQALEWDQEDPYNTARTVSR